MVDLPTSWKMSVMVPAVAIDVGNGQRDALARLVGDDDHELARPGLARHVRSAHHDELGHVAQTLLLEDVVHRSFSLCISATSAVRRRRIHDLFVARTGWPDKHRLAQGARNDHDAYQI